MPAEDVAPAERPLTPRRRRLLQTTDRRVRRRRLITYSIFAASLVLMTHALLGENGYFATLRAQRQHAEVEAALTRVRMENQRLREESRRLRDDPRQHGIIILYRASVTGGTLEAGDDAAEVAFFAADALPLEEAARRDLGLIRPGETLVVVKKAQKPETPR